MLMSMDSPLCSSPCAATKGENSTSSNSAAVAVATALRLSISVVRTIDKVCYVEVGYVKLAGLEKDCQRKRERQ